MGIENRDYLRDEYDDGPGMGRRMTSASIVVKLIAVTVGVFILQLLFANSSGGTSITDWLELSGPDLYQRGQIWRLVTYAFCHGIEDPLHIVFNMLGLYFAGNALLNLIGRREFLWFYLVSAAFSGLFAVLYYTITKQNASLVGASGALFAIVCVITMHYPRMVVRLFGVIPIELRWLLPLGLVLPMLFTENTSHSGHVGGVVFGFLYFRGSMNLSKWWDQFAGRVSMKRRNKGRLRIFAPPTAPDANLDAQMDPILEKISREGEASLTARERNILIQASRKLKKDRS